MTFSQSFFEQNVSVQLKLLRFSSIFLLRNKARNAGRSRKNAGMRDFPHDCGTVDTYDIIDST